jgi:uncharacterized secreted protein with C-terminal beta-propeller domain
MTDRIRRLLQAVAERGAPRGADAVLAGARGADRSPRPAARWIAAGGIAAAVALLTGVLALTGGDHDGGSGSLALVDRSTTTVAEEETSMSEVPTSIAAGAVPSTTSTPVKAAATARLVAFNTCDNFLSTVKVQAASVVGPWGLGGMTMTLQKGAPTALAAPTAERSSAPAAPTADAAADTSSTNVQEADVDEPDTVKTDGQTIFTVVNGKVVAVAARGAPRLLGSLPVEGNELLLVGNRLLVLGNGGFTKRMVTNSAGPTTLVAGSSGTILDVRDPANMRVLGRVNLEGSYVAARAVDGVARIVVQSGPVGLDFVTPKDDSEPARREATDRNKQVVAGSTIANWAPGVTVTDAAGRAVRSGNLLSCGAAYRPATVAGFGMLTLVTLDPNQPANVQSTSVMADGDLVYASTGRLYVATTSWGAPTPDGRTFAPATTTLVHDFDITGRANARYVGSGAVRGQFLNQFSFSEHEGRLRVATTDYAVGGNESFVTVLQERAGALVQVGQVGGLGKGERIYAVRFLGDRGYVVTFRQVDPLHVLDLSDPAKPRLVGELHVPGYSAYLHPVSDTLLLGIGQDVSPEGRRLGAKVSLFDVTDPARPREVQSQPLGTAFSSSPVEYDHHAFLWWAPRGLALVPVQQNDQAGSTSFVAGIKVTGGGLAEAGRAAHPSNAQCGQRTCRPVITRSVIVGDRLFTLSTDGLLASDLATFADQAWVPFPAAEQSTQPQPQPAPAPAR